MQALPWRRLRICWVERTRVRKRVFRAFLLSVILSGCVDLESRIRALQVEVEQVNQQIKKIEMAHPEVEETLIRHMRLEEEKALLEFVVDSRDGTLKGLSDLPSGEGPATRSFVP